MTIATPTKSNVAHTVAKSLQENLAAAVSAGIAASGQTTAQIAEAAGVPEGTVTRLDAATAVTPEEAYLIARALDGAGYSAFLSSAQAGLDSAAVGAWFSVTPDSGPTAGGTAVVITGHGFTGATGVTVGGAAGTAFSVVSDTEINVTTPAGTAGAKDVVIQQPSGNRTLTGAFTYV